MSRPRTRVRPAAGIWLLLIAALLVACSESGPGGAAGPDGAAGPAPAAPSTAVTSTATPALGDPDATTEPGDVVEPDRGTPFDHQPLWPFADQQAAAAWQQAYQEGGPQPWHLDHEATALGFTQGYLGFEGIDRVVGSIVDGDEAWVSVGYLLPNGSASTAAEVHLARYGTGDDAPWEVVGTRDDTLTLDIPGYGSEVSSPLQVGGEITGVDESLHVAVLRLDGDVPGEACCPPAGGERERWSVSVAYSGPADGSVATVVVSTGGHVADVERFAITAVRTG